MAENKFIKHLKGEQAVGSLVEIKNQNTPASFGNMPQGTSDSNVKYSDVRGDVTVVANGTTAWKLNDSALTLAPIVNGDGTDYTGKYEVSGAGLWVNSTYTFPSTGDPNHPVAMIFNPNSKWVLKLCGDNLIVNDGNTLELTVVITIGSSNIISKQFTIREQANQFCKELVIDFDESSSALIKASGLSTMQLQVLCGTADASARIYNGMTTLTVLQRKVDAAVVSGTFANVEEVLRDGILPSDYFNNAAYIAQIEDGDSAYAVFTRDGDTVALSGWAQPIPDQTNNAGKFLTTDGSLMSWAQLTISDVDGLSTELSDLQGQITTNKDTMDSHIGNTNNPHSVTKAQVGLGNVDNTADADKPISTATQSALDTKANNTNRVNGAPLSNSASVFYGTSDTAATTVQKEVSIPSITTLDAGTIIIVQPTVTSTVANSTIKLNNFSAYPMRYNNAAITTSTDSIVWNAAYPSVWVFDGTYWRFVAHGIDSNTTYSTMSVSEGTTGTAISNRVLQAVNLKQIIQGTTLTGIDVVTTGAVSATDTITEGIGKLQATKADTSVLATVATTGDYDDLLNKPTIPTVNDATLTIQKNGTSVATFTANASSNVTANISVPTTTNDLTNNSGFITSSDIPVTDVTVGGTSVVSAGVAVVPVIPTVNNPTITITQGGVTKGSFSLNQASGDTIALDAGGGSSVDIDNSTITKNLSDEIQAVATVNQNTATGATNPIYDWVGTFEEYQTQNIATLHPDWLCFIKNKTALNRYLVEAQYPTAENNYTWYFLYNDGWVEQGGYYYKGSSIAGNNTITLPIEMADTNYTVLSLIQFTAPGNAYVEVEVYPSRTTTSFVLGVPSADYGYNWEVKGMAA